MTTGENILEDRLVDYINHCYLEVEGHKESWDEFSVGFIGFQEEAYGDVGFEDREMFRKHVPIKFPVLDRSDGIYIYNLKPMTDLEIENLSKKMNSYSQFLQEKGYTKIKRYRTALKDLLRFNCECDQRDCKISLARARAEQEIKYLES